MRLGWLVGTLLALLAGSARATEPPSPSTNSGPDLPGVAVYVHQLENMPLSPETKEWRKNLYDWFVQAPRVSIHWCAGMLLDAPRKDRDMAGDLLVQAMLSAGAYVIEHPENEPPPLEQARASLHGALLTYKATVAAEPKKASRYFDHLVALDAKGKLNDYLIPKLSNCGVTEMSVP